ncbi:hypothetical protein RAS1_34360 [Phycisphaerae bacterium RAS1]|nr:hypothetical protein RAS1_34360 [Phycisphaerae bacterium RAS1]
MTRLLILAAMLLTGAAVNADTIYSQPPSPAGGLHQSAWWDPDGSDYDIYIWDNFTLSSSQTITEIRWRGGFIYGGSFGGPVLDFSVEIWPSIAAGSQPAVAGQPLVRYFTGGNAGETYAGVFGGAAMYDYQFTLPSPFPATGGVKYWVQIEAYQHGIPEWGLATGTGGNGAHFRFLEGASQYQSAPADMAFLLIGSGGTMFNVATSCSPPAAGKTTGDGAYPAGSVATVVATPSTGFGFVNWTEAGQPVSQNRSYAFTVHADHTLVANFTPAYTVTTAAWPSFGGSTDGGGTFNSGSTVTVTATPDPLFAFVDWTEFGTPVSTSATYEFAASANRVLVANFVPRRTGAIFDFDNATPGSSLPISLTLGTLTANFSATGSGYSIQRADTLGFTPAGFGGYCLYPSSVFAADLIVDLGPSLVSDFSILYSPQELGCDDSARMRATAFQGGVQVATNTATAPLPGNWPTGTLRVSAAQGFDRVIVHYDARPPTCQDWGPIFLADNMVVLILPHAGDLNCDGSTNVLDINPFVLALSDPAAFVASFPTCPLENGDVNGDGHTDILDINPLVTLIAGG